jgi:hypothetical protein
MRKERESPILRYDFENDLAQSILTVNRSKDVRHESNVSAAEELEEDIRKIKEMKEIRESFDYNEKARKQEEQRLKEMRLNLSPSTPENKKQEHEEEQMLEEEEESPDIDEAWKNFWRAYEKAEEHSREPVTRELLSLELAVLGGISKSETVFKSIFKEYINFRLVGWVSEKVIFDEFEYFKGIWIKVGGKEINQEFLSNYYLADLMYGIEPKHGLKFRIAPMFLMKYKGFKGLCMMNMPFASIKKLSKEVYNVKVPLGEMDNELAAKIKENFVLYEKIMNVKSEKYINEDIELSAPLGHDVKVFLYDNKLEDADKNMNFM